MHVLVIGGGVIGVSTAYYLARAGAKVTVVERNEELSRESSYSNGAQLSYSHSEPWSSRASILKGLKWMFRKDAPLYFRPFYALKASSWIARFIWEARAENYFHNAKAINALSFYSRDLMLDFQSEHQIDFDYSDNGIMHFYSNKRALEVDYKFFEFLMSINPKLEVLRMKANDAQSSFPNLEAATRKRSGAIYCKNDHLGDVHKFTLELAAISRELGVEFMHGANLDDFSVVDGKVGSVIISGVRRKFDNYVIAGGAYSGIISKKAGVSLPIYPMKGYSITATGFDPALLPDVSITDHATKIVITPLTNAIRVAGTAEFGGFDHAVNRYRILPLVKSLRRNFPNIGCDPKIRFAEWACLRSQTPRSYPYICRSHVKNLFVNTGHGSLGWTQALGSAKLISDIVLGSKVDIEADPFKL